MANEFYYSVSLHISHPRIDPSIITKTITHLRPSCEIMAGTECRGKDGKPIIPTRIAPLSHWSANLHDEEKLYSGTNPISEFFYTSATELEPYRDLFAQIRLEGRIQFFIGWFSESLCAAEQITAEVLKKCGDLGIDFEFHCYGIDQKQNAD